MNTTFAIAAAAGLALLAAAPAAASDVSGDRIRALVEGRTVHLATPYGVELPLRYKPGGTVSGDISGITLARLFRARPGAGGSTATVSASDGSPGMTAASSASRCASLLRTASPGSATTG